MIWMKALKELFDRAGKARKTPSMVQYATKRGRSMRSDRTRYMSVDTAHSRKKTPIGLRTHPDNRWKNRVQRTRGYEGKFKRMKRFKLKGRKKKVAQAIEFKYETGGIQQDAECVYLGLGSCPVIYLRRCIAACVVKELSKQANLTFNDWKESPFEAALPADTVLSVRMYYYTDVTSNNLLNVTSGTINAQGGGTWENLLDAFSLVLSQSAASSPTTVIDSVVLRYADISEDVKIKGKIEASDIYIGINFFGNMNLQNVTLASDGVGGETVDISNNPLYGKMYHTSSGNGFLPVSREDFTTGATLTASPFSGIIAHGAVELSPNFRKPVPPQVIRKVNKHSNINLNPGEMKRFYVKFAKTHSLTRWFALLGEDFLNQENFLREGSATMVALEKRLNNRTESNPVIVNYEVNYSFGGYYRYTEKPVTMPIVQIF